MSVDPNSVKPQPPLVQHEAVAASSLMSYVISLLIGLVGITLLAAYWFNHEANKVSIQHAAEASYPDLERLRLAGLQKLTRYERIDNGKFRIPVDQAIIQLAVEFPEDAPISKEMQP